MNELSLQSDLCKVVIAHGGAAHKLSNRFLIGVSDLLVKLPDYRQAALIEAKYEKLKPTAKREAIDLDVTVQQGRFLSKYYKAGMLAGVISFVRRGAGKKQEMGVLIVPWTGRQEVRVVFESSPIRVLLDDHRWGSMRDRSETIWWALDAFMKGNDK